MLKMKVVIVILFIITTTHCYYQDGDVRLVGGSYQWEGRVEVYMSGVWGTITDSDWTNDDATVVCRKLGHFRPGAIAYSNAYFGEGRGVIFLELVQCTGKEYNLTECKLRSADSTSGHSFDVGVACQPAEGSYKQGDIRLVGGSHNWEGRVEIYWNRDWSTISDSSWSDNDAQVVCRQLQHGYNSGVAVDCCADFGSGSGDVFFQNVMCTGTENNITLCNNTINANASSNHEHDVGIRCEQGNEVREGEIRLNRTGGTSVTAWEGRVEMFLFGQWGTICDIGSTAPDAQVVCRQLGYNTFNSGFATCCGSFGQGSGPIHYRGLGCSGTENRLTDCGNLTYNCYHSDDWSVYCQIAVMLMTTSSYNFRRYYTTINNVVCSGSELKLTDCSYSDFQNTYINALFRMDCSSYPCSDGDVRLVGGGSEREGRVEVCSTNRWGTVCSKDWSNKHTAVVCRYMGYSDISIDVVHNSTITYGDGAAGPVLIDYIYCNGTEGNLWKECIHFTHYYGCSHENDVGVECRPARCSDGQLKLAGSQISSSGRLEICSNQRWTTLYSARWTTTNTKIACQELGFNGGSSFNAVFGNSGGPRHSEYFACSGSETRLSSCARYSDTAVRSSGYDVGIHCSLFTDCDDGDIRLVDGGTDIDGRVEICYDGRWGTVGGDGWTDTNSRVVCNDFGYELSSIPPDESVFKAPSRPMYYHSVRCTSKDLKLLECGFMKSSTDDSALIADRAIVRCKQPTCADGDLRLLGSDAHGEGRLEVCFNKRWGTIDGNGWTERDTSVACHQLGFSGSETAYSMTPRNRKGSSSDLPAFITTVGCYGTEQHLTECSYHEYEYLSMSTPTTSYDVIITCFSSTMGDDATSSSKETEEVPTEKKTVDTTVTPVTGSEDGVKANQTDAQSDTTNSGQSNIVAIIALGVSAVLGLAVIVLIIIVVVIAKKKLTSPQYAVSDTVYFSNKDKAAKLQDNKPLKDVKPHQDAYEVVKPSPMAPRSYPQNNIANRQNDLSLKANPSYEKVGKHNKDFQNMCEETQNPQDDRLYL